MYWCGAELVFGFGKRSQNRPYETCSKLEMHRNPEMKANIWRLGRVVAQRAPSQLKCSTLDNVLTFLHSIYYIRRCYAFFLLPIGITADSHAHVSNTQMGYQTRLAYGGKKGARDLQYT